MSAGAQKIDSIYFNLYTDSLKKGQHNYINVDGKMKDGKWLPLSSDEIIFHCDEAKFEGNELVIPEDFKPLKVTIKVCLKDDPKVFLERTIPIKQTIDPPLPTKEDIMPGNKKKKNKD